MADECSGGVAGRELPQAESLVPGGGESVGTVGGDDAVGNDVGVAVQRSLGEAILLVVTGEVPDDESLVSRAG